MNRLKVKYLLFPLLAVLAGGTPMLSVADEIGKPGGANNDLVEQATFSPRAYCRKRGGIVSETQDKDIYLCCYKSKSKCVVTDTAQSVSWLIPYRESSLSHSHATFEYTPWR